MTDNLEMKNEFKQPSADNGRKKKIHNMVIA